MHCILCGGLILVNQRLVNGYHYHCAKIQKCLEEKFWPEGHYYDVVFHLYGKYRLSLNMAPMYDIVSTAGAIRNHWLVCKFLEEYPDVAGKYALRKLLYYDVLAAAEKKYVGRTDYTVLKELEEC